MGQLLKGYKWMKGGSFLAVFNTLISVLGAGEVYNQVVLRA
jgi:hypothetical protein